MSDAGAVHRAGARLLESRQLNTQRGVWNEFLFIAGGQEVVVLQLGALTETMMVRVHSACLSAHYFDSVECDCREQLAAALDVIYENRSGVVVLLDQDGRGNGHLALMQSARLSQATGMSTGEAYATLGYPPDARVFEPAVEAIQALGVKKVLLLTNSPSKLDSFHKAGLDVERMRIVVPGPMYDDFYANKAREGHLVAGAGGSADV